MLVELSVRNFAIVEDKSIQFGKGLSVFTGETGAGKSLLLAAITLLLGSKNQKDLVREGFESAYVEGTFNLSKHPEKRLLLDALGFDCDENHLLIVKREIAKDTSASRNRVWIQGSVATRQQLQDILGDWIEVSGQHEFLRLNKESYLLDVLDDFAELRDQRNLYSASLARLRAAEKKRLDLESKSSDRLHLIDLRRYQIEEFQKAEITESTPLQEEEWARDRQRLSSLGKIITAVEKSLFLLENPDGDCLGSLNNLKLALQELRPFDSLDPEIARILELLDQARSTLLDGHADLQKYHQKLDIDPSTLNEMENRLSVINRLKRKYSCDTAGLLAKLQEARSELNLLERFEEELADLKHQYSKIESELRLQARSLHQKRISAAKKMNSLWQKYIQSLGIPQANFTLELTEVEEFGAYGCTKIQALFSANPGLEPKPLHKVASGGELSRILLALKQIISGKSEVCAYLFDEVDAGLGGETAHRVAIALKTISQNSQVIVVTHLAQISAYADEHFSITKRSDRSKTSTKIEHLCREAKVLEIARMLGASESKAAMALAQDLIKKAKKAEIPTAVHP